MCNREMKGILTLIIIFALAACGGGSTTSGNDDGESRPQQEQEDADSESSGDDDLGQPQGTAEEGPGSSDVPSTPASDPEPESGTANNPHPGGSQGAALPSLEPLPSRVDSWTYVPSSVGTDYPSLHISEDGSVVGALEVRLGGEQTRLLLWSHGSAEPLLNALIPNEKSDLAIFPGGTNSVTAIHIRDMAMSADGSLVVVRGFHNFHVYSRMSATPHFSGDLDIYKDGKISLERFISEVAISGDGSRILVADDTDQVAVYSTNPPSRLFVVQQELVGYASAAEIAGSREHAALSEDGSFFVVGGTKALIAYDGKTGNVLWRFEDIEPSGHFEKVEISKDGHYIFAEAVAERSHTYFLFSDNFAGPLLRDDSFLDDSFLEDNLFTQGNSAGNFLSGDGHYLAHIQGQGLDMANFRVIPEKMVVRDGLSGQTVSQVEHNIPADSLEAYLSSSGKYAMARSGLPSKKDILWSSIYLSDRDYGLQNEPFRWFDVPYSLPGDMTMSRDASSLVYIRRGDSVGGETEVAEIVYSVIHPHVLPSIEDAVPVYAPDDTMRLRTFLTNPSVEKDLELVLEMYLAETTPYQKLADEIQKTSPSRAADKTAEFFTQTLGRHTVFKKTFQVPKGESLDQIQSIQVPHLDRPAWLSKFLDAIPVDAILSKILAPVYKTVNDLADRILPAAVANGVRSNLGKLNNSGSTGIYPAMAVIEVTLRDAASGFVYGRRGLPCVYLVSFSL